MSLENINDNTPEGNRKNVEALQRNKADKAPYIDRAPVAGDPGSEYWQYANGGTNLTHWKRHPISGTWYSEVYA